MQTLIILQDKDGSVQSAYQKGHRKQPAIMLLRRLDAILVTLDPAPKMDNQPFERFVFKAGYSDRGHATTALIYAHESYQARAAVPA